MKHWSLGAKLAAWSALTVTVGLLLCCIGAGIFIRGEQIDALDEQLQNEAHIFFGEFERHRDTLDWQAPEQVKQMVPLTLTERFLDIRGTDDKSRYRSPNLQGAALSGFKPGLWNTKVAGNAVRLGVFQEDGLTLCLAADLAEVDGDTRELVVGFLAGFPLLVATVCVGGWWLARKALAPVRAITIAAEEIKAEHLDRRLPVPAVRDEIGRLSMVLNAMFDRLDVSFRQAMRFSADASHELKTPLTLLRASIEDLLESPTLAESDHAAIGALLEQTRRLASIIESLLLLSRADAGQLRLDFKETNVADVIKACTEDAAIMAERRGIRIEADVPAQLPAEVDADRLTQVLLNLLDNAIKYNVRGGCVRVAAEMGGDELTITVANTSPGIRAEQASQLFERFFRSDPSPETPGHGLGLSLARELARAHGGEVELKHSDAEWTVFSIRLAVRV